MHKENEIYCGLNIGSANVTAVIGRGDPGGRLEILGIGRTPTQGITNGDLVIATRIAQCIKAVIKQAEDMAEVDIASVTVGLTTDRMFIKKQRESILKEDPDTVFEERHVMELNRLMYRINTKPGTDIVHVLPQQYTVDGVALGINPKGSLGNKLQADFAIVSLEQNTRRTLNAALRDAEFSLDRLMVEPLASGFSVLNREDKHEGVCLLDMGEHFTSMAIYYQGSIQHIEVLPYGGKRLTESLHEALRIKPKYARLLKEQFGCALAELTDPNERVNIPCNRRDKDRSVSVFNVARVIEADMEDMVKDIHAQLIASGYEEILRGGIVLCGGASKLQGITEIFEYITGIETRLGNPAEHLADNSIRFGKDPSLSSAIGLAMADLLDEEERRYLVPGEMPQSRKHKPKSAKDEGKKWYKRSLDIFKNLLNDDISGFDDKDY